MKSYALIVILLFSAFAAADFTITDSSGNSLTSLSFNSDTPNEEKIVKLTNLLNDTTDSLNFSSVGGTSSYLQFLSLAYQPISNFVVDPLVSNSFIVKLLPTAANAPVGSYSGAIAITSLNTSQTKTISINYTKQKWTFSYSKTYVESDSAVNVKVGSSILFKIKVKTVKDGVVSFDVVTADGTKIGSDQLSTGDPVSDFDDIGIEVVRLIGTTAKLKIYYADEDMTFSVEKSSGIGSGSLIPSVPSHVVRRLSTDPILTIGDIVTNGLDDAVKLNPPTVTPEGVSWITLGTMNIVSLNPNDKITIPIIIDSSKAPSGTYSASVIVSGFYKNQPVSVTIPYSITFVQDESAQLENNTLGMPTFTLSKTNVGIDEEITVTISNVFESDEIRLETTPLGYVASQLPKIRGNEWEARIKFPKQGVYSLKVQVFRKGLAILADDSKKVFAGVSGIGLKIRLENELSVSNPSKIFVFDDNNNSIEGAFVTINGVESKDHFITPTAATNEYSICANFPPYTPTSPCPSFKLRTGALACSLNPQFPFEGDPVAFTCNSPEGTAIKDYSVFVDGERVTNPTTFKKGEHKIEVISSEGYAPANFTITTLAPAKEIKLSGAFQTGGQIKVDLGSEPSSYSIYFAEKESDIPLKVEERPLKTLDTFSPQKIGYYVFKSGSVQKQVFVEGNQPWDGYVFGIKKTDLIIVSMLIVSVVLVGLVLSAYTKRKDIGFRQQLRTNEVASGTVLR